MRLQNWQRRPDRKQGMNANTLNKSRRRAQVSERAGERTNDRAGRPSHYRERAPVQLLLEQFWHRFEDLKQTLDPLANARACFCCRCGLLLPPCVQAACARYNAFSIQEQRRFVAFVKRFVLSPNAVAPLCKRGSPIARNCPNGR